MTETAPALKGRRRLCRITIQLKNVSRHKTGIGNILPYRGDMSAAVQQYPAHGAMPRVSGFNLAHVKQTPAVITGAERATNPLIHYPTASLYTY
jgi:hypothetical protein